MKKEDIDVCILRVGGTNCDGETERAFRALGVGVEVAVEVLVAVALAVGVAVGVWVGVALAVGVAVAVGVIVTVVVAVGVTVNVAVGVGVDCPQVSRQAPKQVKPAQSRRTALAAIMASQGKRGAASDAWSPRSRSHSGRPSNRGCRWSSIPTRVTASPS